MMPSKSTLALTALLVAALSPAGCATASRREIFLHEKAGEHVYRQPLSQVWVQARSLLLEEGYSLMESQRDFEMLTEWLMQGSPSSLGTTYSRYLVRGFAQGPGQSSVKFYKQMRSESRPAYDPNARMEAERPSENYNQLTRDHALEWKLLQRMDAEAAKALESEAALKYP